jgi:hypothetical protein
MNLIDAVLGFNKSISNIICPIKPIDHAREQRIKYPYSPFSPSLELIMRCFVKTPRSSARKSITAAKNKSRQSYTNYFK